MCKNVSDGVIEWTKIKVVVLLSEPKCTSIFIFQNITKILNFTKITNISYVTIDKLYCLWGLQMKGWNTNITCALNLSLICFNNLFHLINFQTFLFCNYSFKKNEDMTTMSCGCWCTTSQSDSIHDFILSLEPFKY
jgi:hypothetical protein